MNSANATHQTSNMITEDALMKLYPIYHGSDELEMDMLELELVEKEEELNAIDDKKEVFDYFETALPNRRTKLMEPQSMVDMCTELRNSLKGMFDPNSLLHTDDELKFEIIKKKISKSEGFMLCSVFQPADEQHRNMINNILCDFKYTILLFSKHEQRISNMLNNAHPDWYQNVHFLIIEDLDEPAAHYTLDVNHWLNLCRFEIIGNAGSTVRRKLLNYMRERLNIICVHTHEEVQHEFERNSKKYVSFYTLNHLLLGRNCFCVKRSPLLMVN